MIVSEIESLPAGDPQFAWSALAQFQNVAHVTDAITRLHQPPADQLQNVKKQAQQIRYCLNQSQQYFAAATATTMATRPLLLYYGVMSLALAEILFKGSGNQSLDRARGQHAHHGLDFRVGANPSRIQALGLSAAQLRAAPLLRGNQRIGTFELWHRLARELPVVGEVTTNLPWGGRREGPNIVMGAEDVPLPKVPEAGLSLLDCLRSHPEMEPVLSRNDVSQACFRARIHITEHQAPKRVDWQVIFQPTADPIGLMACLEKAKFPAEAVNRISIQDFPSGHSFSWSVLEADRLNFHFPQSIQTEHKDAYYLGEIDSLNEFGILYVGIYILGNYCRYFPDQWMLDLEKSSPLFLSAEAFSRIVEKRAPVLTLTELTRTYFISESY